MLRILCYPPHPGPTATCRLTTLLALVLSLVMPILAAQKPVGRSPLTLSFNNEEFLHRFSRDAQHEFTPAGQEDLAKWTSMITLNVVASASTGEQLAEIANRVLGNYQKAGKIIRTDSKPRTANAAAEHLIVAILGRPEFLEAAFARVLLHDGQGLVVVYSRRVYGAKAGNEMSAWLEKNGPDAERALMAWTGMPAQAQLQGLK